LPRLRVRVHFHDGTRPGRQCLLALWRLRRGLERLETKKRLELGQEMVRPARELTDPDPAGGSWKLPDTPFPTLPADVVQLSEQEFAGGLQLQDIVSIDMVCHRFPEDTNRALVWFIRFRALITWCEQAEIAPWLLLEPRHAPHACAVAASFALNAGWEFDTDRFRSAVESHR